MTYVLHDKLLHIYYVYCSDEDDEEKKEGASVAGEDENLLKPEDTQSVSEPAEGEQQGANVANNLRNHTLYTYDIKYINICV